MAAIGCAGRLPHAGIASADATGCIRSGPMQSTTSSTKRYGIRLAATLTGLIAFQIPRYTARGSTIASS